MKYIVHQELHYAEFLWKPCAFGMCIYAELNTKIRRGMVAMV